MLSCSHGQTPDGLSKITDNHIQVLTPFEKRNNKQSWSLRLRKLPQVSLSSQRRLTDRACVVWAAQQTSSGRQHVGHEVDRGNKRISDSRCLSTDGWLPNFTRKARW